MSKMPVVDVKRTSWVVVPVITTKCSGYSFVCMEKSWPTHNAFSSISILASPEIAVCHVRDPVDVVNCYGRSWPGHFNIQGTDITMWLYLTLWLTQFSRGECHYALSIAWLNSWIQQRLSIECSVQQRLSIQHNLTYVRDHDCDWVWLCSDRTE